MRMREFEQMEMQFFVRPGEDKKWFEYWKEARLKWHKAIGTAPEKYRYHDHVKLAHYATQQLILSLNSIGFKEVEGIHSRTDFDLSQHQEYSGKKMQYVWCGTWWERKAYGNYVPYVLKLRLVWIECSWWPWSMPLEEEDLSTPEKQDSKRCYVYIRIGSY